MAASAVSSPSRPRAAFTALRRDAWWVEPLFVVVVLTAFGIYSLWVAITETNYAWGPYISPFYSPCLAVRCGEHTTIPLFGSWWPVSAAFLVLWSPLIFRLTCYYYRKAYYRSFFWSPPACAVPDARSSYSGETGFPLILQNLHRYAFYLSLPVVFFLWVDVIRAFIWPNGFGMGLGTLVLLVATSLLTLYTFSCHSCRHLVGGHVDVFSRSLIRYRLWRWVSVINHRHALYAWLSLFGVALADLYVRLVASGVIRDVRFI